MESTNNRYYYPLCDRSTYVFRGPSYYIPSQRRWITVNDYKSLPPDTRKGAILFESETEWRKYQEQYGLLTNSLQGIPAKFPTSHTSVMSPNQYSAWTRRWDGSGFFVPSSQAWMHEQIGPNIPTESLLFYNEEDWIKFKFMSENASIPNIEKVKMITR